MFDGRTIIFSAPSGGGKTTIVNALIEQFPHVFGFSVSATTRPKRPYEQEGVHYYFMTTEEFRQKIQENAFVEYEEVYEGLFYGTLKTEIDRIWQQHKHILLDVDAKGGKNLKAFFKEKALSIFLMPPSLDVLKERLQKRGTESASSLAKRLEKASAEIAYAQYFDKVVVNDNLEKTTHEVIAYVREFLGL